MNKPTEYLFTLSQKVRDIAKEIGIMKSKKKGCLIEKKRKT